MSVLFEISTRVALAWAVPLLAALAIVTEATGRSRFHYVFKPAATLAVIGVAWTAVPGEAGGGYQRAILIGLAASLAGDVFLMLPADWFLHGLASFLLAHVCYMAAFATTPAWPGSLFTLLPLAALGLSIYRLLAPGLGALRAPVAVYAAALAGMAWQAAERFFSSGPAGAGCALAGALLFMLSDSLLGWSRFRRPLPASQVWVLGTYFAAQLLIALSV